MKFTYLLAAASLATFAACDNKKSDTPEVKEKIDDALDRRPNEEAKDAVEDAKDAAKDVGEDVKDATKDAGDAIKEGAQDLKDGIQDATR